MVGIDKSSLQILSKNDSSFKKNKFSINKIEKQAEITDFAVLLGGYINNCGYNAENRNGYYWTSTSYYKPSRTDIYDEFGECIYYGDDVYKIYVIDPFGKEKMWMPNATSVGIRPALKVDLESDTISNLIYCHNKQVGMRIGNYPQNAVSSALQIILENDFNRGNIDLTGVVYTLPLVKEHDEIPVIPYNCYEFEYNKKKYVRVKANFYSKYFEKYYRKGKFYKIDRLYDSDTTKLSNGVEYSNGDYVWVEVSPVDWILNKKNDLLISKKIIVAGVAKDYTDILRCDEEDAIIMGDYIERYLNNDLFNHQSGDINTYEKEITKVKSLHK